MMTEKRLMNFHITDSHNHLHSSDYDLDRQDVMDRSIDTGVSSMLLVGIDPDDSKMALHTADNYRGCYAAIGIHPQLADSYTPEDVYGLSELAQEPKVIGIGETGFDLFYNPETEDRQKDMFLAHLELARQVQLPIIIHERDAHDKTVMLLDESGGWSSGGVFHCFSGDVSLARKVLDEGFYVSVSGVVTFKNAQKLMDVVKFCPLDRILIETDAPYLSPVPFRGKRNEPSYIQYTLNEVARLKDISFEEAARVTSSNFDMLFTKKVKFDKYQLVE